MPLCRWAKSRLRLPNGLSVWKATKKMWLKSFLMFRVNQSLSSSIRQSQLQHLSPIRLLPAAHRFLMGAQDVTKPTTITTLALNVRTTFSCTPWTHLVLASVTSAQSTTAECAKAAMLFHAIDASRATTWIHSAFSAAKNAGSRDGADRTIDERWTKYQRESKSYDLLLELNSSYFSDEIKVIN